jgi:hypothetical protein
LLFEDGEDANTTTTTANIYAHVTPAMVERTASRVDGSLTRKRASGA